MQSWAGANIVEGVLVESLEGPLIVVFSGVALLLGLAGLVLMFSGESSIKGVGLAFLAGYIGAAAEEPGLLVPIVAVAVSVLKEFIPRYEWWALGRVAAYALCLAIVPLGWPLLAVLGAIVIDLASEFGDLGPQLAFSAGFGCIVSGTLVAIAYHARDEPSALHPALALAHVVSFVVFGLLTFTSATRAGE